MKELDALRLHNAKLQAALESTAGLEDGPAGQVQRLPSPSENL